MPSEVNFLPNPASPIETPPFFYSDSTIAGFGSPEGVVPAWPGTHYADRDTGDTYIKQSGDGTLTGWAQEASGGGGAGVVATSGDPEGVLTASVRTLAWDASAKVLYVKNTGSGNTGWQELIAVP